MKSAAVMLVILIAGMMALNLLGGFFVREVIQEPMLVESLETVSGTDLERSVPYFELLDLEGNKIKSSDFLGTPAVLTFWTTWNVAAADQVKIFDDYLRKDSRNLFNVIAISSQEDRSVVANFISRGGYEIKVLLDESGAITETYQAWNLPTTYFLDERGILREVFIGILSEKQLVEKAEIFFSPL